MRIALPTTLLSILSLLSIFPAHALQTVEVADGHTVTIQVSAHELTRLAMAEGRTISRVWGLEERMSVESDKESGQVFIRPLQGLRPFSLFVKDDRGATYTLVAVPVEMPSDAVVLKPRPGTSPGSKGRPHPFIVRVSALMRAMATGEEPPGYMRIRQEKPISLWEGIKLMLIQRFEGDLLGEIYRLSNTANEPLQLTERRFGALAGNIKAVAIDRRELEPGQSTRVYLVREGE